MSEKILYIYTDGACKGNPGPGGWGSILFFPSANVKELGGFESVTTNNRMELLAAIEALSYVDQNARGLSIRILTDSKYMVEGATKWLHSWKKKGWLQADGKSEVKNIDLWLRLDPLQASLKPKWEHVDAHIGNPANERCDEIAVAFSQGERPELYEGDEKNYSISLEESLRFKKQVGPKQAPIYLSYVNGKIFKDKTWDECKARVQGIKSAKYKKISSPHEEASILKKWGANT